MTIPETVIYILVAIAGFECGYIVASYVDDHFRTEKSRVQASRL